MRRHSLLVALVALTFLTGCAYERRETHTARTATEQLLLSTSIRRSIEANEFAEIRGKSVAVEIVGLAADAENAVIRERIADRIRDGGGTVFGGPSKSEVTKTLEADGGAAPSSEPSMSITGMTETLSVSEGSPDLVMRVYVATSGTVDRSIGFGIPQMSSQFFTFPGLWLFKFDRNYGYTKVAVTLQDAKTQAIVSRSEPTIDRTHFNVFLMFFLFAIRTNDIYPGEEWSFGLY